MPGTVDQLRNTFYQVVAAFNSHDASGVANYLADNVTVVSVRYKTCYTPKQAAVAYIKGDFVDSPSFNCASPGVSINPSGTAGTVAGQATWKDNANPTGEVLPFIFTAVWDVASGAWLFTDVRTA